MAAIQQYHIKALTPTWFLVKLTPALASREGGSKKPAPGAAYSPLLLSPAVWQKAQDEKKDKDGAERARLGAAGFGVPRRRRSRRQGGDARARAVRAAEREAVARVRQGQGRARRELPWWASLPSHDRGSARV